MTQDGRQRKRRRGSAPAGPPATTVNAAPAAPSAKAAPKRRRDHSERALHDLAGTGASQLSISRALRARDVNRPSERDLAEAESDLHIVRRNWTPQT